MLGILIFDQLNDIIYIKSDLGFLRHVQGMAVAQGLNSPSEINDVSSGLFWAVMRDLARFWSVLVFSENVYCQASTEGRFLQ
jgi:hypothetical protein